MTFTFPIETQDQKALIGCGVAFSLLPAVVVYLRILARHKANRPIDTSDYLIVISCLFVVCYQAITISAVFVGGLGFHVDDIQNRFGIESGATVFMKHLVALQIFWALGLSFCRISIIHLFARIFVIQSFIVTARITCVVIFLWALGAILTPFVACRPFEYTWDKSIEGGGTCGNPLISWFVTGSVSMICDLVILLMPMPSLLRLELAWTKRLMLAATFGIGILTCVVSVMRIISIAGIDLEDVTFTMPHAILFSALEPCIAVTLACVIVLRPLFGGEYLPDGTATFHTPSVDAIARKNSTRRFRQLNDDSSETRLRPEEVGYRATIAKSPEPFKGFGVLGEGLEMGLISIKQEWTVKEEPRPTTSETQHR